MSAKITKENFVQVSEVWYEGCNNPFNLDNYKCPECGITHIWIEDKYCSNCGVSLKWDLDKR